MNLTALHQFAAAAREADAAMDGLDQAVTRTQTHTDGLYRNSLWFYNPLHWREGLDEWTKSAEQARMAFQGRRDGCTRYVTSIGCLWSELDAVISQAMHDLPQVRAQLAALQADFPSPPFFPENHRTERMRLEVRATVWRKLDRALAAITAAEGKAAA